MLVLRYDQHYVPNEMGQEHLSILQLKPTLSRYDSPCFCIVYGIVFCVGNSLSCRLS